MPGFDALIAAELSAEIKKKLDKRTLRKVERILFTRYGISIKQSIEDFEKLDNVLKEFLGSTRHNFESQMVKKVFIQEKTKDHHNICIRIRNPKLRIFLITCYSNLEILKIFSTPFKKSLTISEILALTKIPKSSGYRKISQLIRNGLLVKTSTTRSGSKRVEKFTKLFHALDITIKEGKNEIIAKIPYNIYEQSTVVKLQDTFS